MTIEDFASFTVALCVVIAIAALGVALRDRWRDRKRGIPPIAEHDERYWR